MTADTQQPLHEVFYCSTLTPDLPPATVGAIVNQARNRNADRNITGLLVFDGIRFCQHLEGPREEVEILVQRIVRDPRHMGVRLVYQGPLHSRHYNGFRLGLAESEGPDLMEGVHALEGETAFKHFLALRRTFDISG